MWPQALQMTRDECRGILRRLELESYSHVISVFRAQGGLSENKAKLLEELRSIFHISQERHRAEARRVANDEQLSTIAEAISGPNTWQEWSREGRRSFPMLPRVAPQTALALIANSVAADTASENMKLPYPSDTAALVASEQAAHAEAKSAYDGEKLSWNIISSDPFKVPDIPVVPKKTLKRNMPDSHASSNKRRILNETSPTKMQYQQQKLKQQQYGVEGGGAVVTPTSNIRKLYHNHSKMQQQQKINQQQQQQHQLSQKQQQQLQKQKQPGKKGGAQTKRQTAAKGKKAAQLLKEQQQQQPQQQQQKLHQQSQQQQQIHQPLTLLPESQHHHQQQQQPQYISISSSNTNEVMMQIETSDEYKESAIAAHIMPQIAASKKDISKNLTKLHIPPSTQQTIIGTAGSGQQQSTAARIIPLDSTSTAVTAGASSSAMSSINTTTTNTTPPIILAPKTDKQLISTPVQKYIVEDRQSPAATSPQIMTLPQLSAAANKLRTMNTTILPPGTKLTTKKLPTIAGGTTGIEQSSNHPQVFNIIEGTTITSTTNMAAPAPLHPATPTHTPPAVIQLNNLNSSASGSNTVVEQTLPTTPQPSPAQGKVLTTKLLPIVLSGSSHNKLETLNNETTLVGSGSNTAVSGTALFKTLPTSMLVSAGGSGNTFTTGTHTVFRKPPNIIKTGIIGMGAGNVINTSGTGTSKISSAFGGNSGPQIISNIKLTSGVVTSAGGGGTSTSTQFLKTVSSTGMRANVKICQSPNGKMFIQPANADTLKTAKLQTSLQQKLLPTQLSTTSGGSSIVSQPTQRIAIQKVQIIPAPMSSPGSLSTTLQQHKPTTSLSLSNKANMIFMPTTCGARGGAATISLSKGNNNSKILSKTQQQQQPIDVTKQNVFVIGSVAQQQSSQGLKSSTSRGELANQMITEDTPVDILNMPIIVDNSNTVSSSGSISTTGSNIGDTVTVLSNEIIATATNLNQQEQIQSNQQSSAVVLGVTDWEMELDQATAVAAATKAAARTQRRAVGGSSAATMKPNKSVEKVHRKQQNTTIVVDDNYDDVIVEETFIDDDDGIDEEELHENSSEIGGVVTIEEKNHSAQLVQQIHPPNPQYSSEEMNIIEVVDDEQNSQQKDVTLDDTESGGILKEKLLASPVISKANDENIDTYDNAVEIDENTAIEYIDEDNNEGTEDRTSNFLSLKTNDENNKTTVPVAGNNTDQANSDTNAMNDQTVSTSIDGNNISTKNIVVDTETTIKSSENALVDVETQSPTHKDNSSQDGQ